MNCLVTGGNGFIGSHLVESLLSRGHRVRVLAQHGTSLANISGLPVEVMMGDLGTPGSLRSAARGIDTVFHLAAIVTDWGDRGRFLEVNTGGTRNAINAAVDAGARRFVLVSSLAVHRYRGISDGDEDWPRDNTHMGYGLSKILAEDVVTEAHAAGRIEGVVVRPGVFPFGPRDRTAFLALVRNLRAYAHVGGGNAVLCTAYAENLAHGIALAGEVSGAAGRTYVIADGVRITWRELMDRICAALGVPPIRRSVPFAAAWAAGCAMEAAHALLGRHDPPLVTRYRVLLAARDCYFGIERARLDLGYQPVADLDAGIKRTVAWCRSISPRD